MLHVDAGMCHLAAASEIPQAAHTNALSQRIPLSSQACVSSLTRGINQRTADATASDHPDAKAACNMAFAYATLYAMPA